MNTPDLLPCPFCGGEATYGKIRHQDDSDIARLNGQSEFHFVNCVVCGADSKGLIGAKTKQEAAQRWNRRAHPSPQPADAGLMAEIEKCAEVWASTGHPHAIDHARILREILERQGTFHTESATIHTESATVHTDAALSAAGMRDPIPPDRTPEGIAYEKGREAGIRESGEAWISVKEQEPACGQDVAFIIDCPDDPTYHGRELGGRYIGGHDFSTPGVVWRASLWRDMPAPPRQPGPGKQDAIDAARYGAGKPDSTEPTKEPAPEPKERRRKGLTLVMNMGGHEGWTECEHCHASWRTGQPQVHWWDCPTARRELPSASPEAREPGGG